MLSHILILIELLLVKSFIHSILDNLHSFFGVFNRTYLLFFTFVISWTIFGVHTLSSGTLRLLVDVLALQQRYTLAGGWILIAFLG